MSGSFARFAHMGISRYGLERSRRQIVYLFLTSHSSNDGLLLVSGGGRRAESRFVDRETPGKIGNLLTDSLFHDSVADVEQNICDPSADQLHFRFFHSAGSDRGAPKAYSSSLHGGKRIEGNGVLVHSDSCPVKSLFRFRAGNTPRMNL